MIENKKETQSREPTPPQSTLTNAENESKSGTE